MEAAEFGINKKWKEQNLESAKHIMNSIRNEPKMAWEEFEMSKKWNEPKMDWAENGMINK